GDEHPRMLEAEVPVQARGVVLLDDEHRLLVLERLLCGVAADARLRHGLGRALRVPLRAVRLEAVACPSGRRRTGLLGVALSREAEGREGVDAVLDAGEHLVELELRERGILDLLPGARGGDG